MRFCGMAIIYALYEIGDGQNLPEDNSLAKQVRLMHEVDQRNAPHLPCLKSNWLMSQNPIRNNWLSKRRASINLPPCCPKEIPGVGKSYSHNAAKSLCITCHVMGDQGVKFGSDLTGIGSIRSERDLLEAIVYPSSSISRYYELVTVLTKKGETGGLIPEGYDRSNDPRSGSRSGATRSHQGN